MLDFVQITAHRGRQIDRVEHGPLSVQHETKPEPLRTRSSQRRKTDSTWIAVMPKSPYDHGKFCAQAERSSVSQNRFGFDIRQWSMIIKEITDVRDVDLLLPVVETYSYTAEEMEIIKTQMLAELSEAGDNRHIFIGLEDDAVVAFIEIILKNADNDPDLANGKEIAHVHNLRVRHDLQGKGIGRKMMAFAEDKARQMGKQCLTLGVDDTNWRAVNLYEAARLCRVQRGAWALS